VGTTDANGDPIGTNGVFSLSDGGSAAFTLNEGTYTVAEQDATVTGYNLATTYNGLSVDSIAIEVTADGASVTVMNTYTIPEPTTGTLSVTKSVNNQQGGDAVFTFNYALMDSQERLISGSFTLKNGETWTYDGELPIGTSVTIEEDEALMPANYAPVSAPIESTIAAGANAFTYVNTFNQPFVPQTVYYNLTLNWLEEGTGTILKPATTTPYVQMAPYDASSIAEIENYTYVRAEGDALTGTMNSSKTITFYYTANAIEDETEEIEENDTPLAEVPEEEPIVEEPVVEETPVIDIETDEVPLDDVPQTGDTNNTGILWLILGAGLAGLTTLGFLGKKAKKTR
jgi:LPXTG-motif cell wall-anchored protein